MGRTLVMGKNGAPVWSGETIATENFIASHKGNTIEQLIAIAKKEKSELAYEDIDIIEEYNDIIEQLTR